jgi:adenosylcobinamide-phosphate synthase
MVGRRAGLAGLGLAVDRLWGEPPAPVHPVAAFGRAMTWLEGVLWADRRSAGCPYVAAGVGGAVLLGRLVERLVGRGTALSIAVGLCSASHALAGAARSVARALEQGDLEGARRALPALVGRDVAELDEAAVARAVIESLAENLSDAVVATLWWGLVAGAPGVLGHRAANTLDAMVGHRCPRYRRFGWAAARLDDLAGWVPARLTALLVVLAHPGRAGSVIRIWRGSARAHPSPNAGVAEGAFAAALGLKLGGPTRYRGREEMRPALGDGRLPEASDITRALGLFGRVLTIMQLGLFGLWLGSQVRAVRRPDARGAGR